MDESKAELPSNNYQLVVNFRHCVFRAGNVTRLLFSLYDNTIKQYISEQYIMYKYPYSFPKVGTPEHYIALFKDISHDILSHELYIVGYIYRIGPMDEDINDRNIYAYGPAKNLKDILNPFGVTVFRLHEHMDELKKQMGKECKVEPGEAPIVQLQEFKQASSEFFDLHLDVINGNKQKYNLAPISIGIAHSYTLYNGDIDVVENSGYKYFDKLSIIEPIFNGQWLCTKDSILVSLLEVHAKSTPKRYPNLQVRMSVRHNESYKTLKDRITMGRGIMAELVDEIESVVFRWYNDASYEQRFRILLADGNGGDEEWSLKDLKDYHLYFSLWHVNKRKEQTDYERGFAFIRFTDMVSTNYEYYSLQLYSNLKKLGDGYLDENNKYLKVQGYQIHQCILY